MKRIPLWTFAMLLVGALVLAGSGVASPVHAVVKAAFNKSLKKKIVVDGTGCTLYMFTEDKRNKSTYTNKPPNPDCAVYWPAYTTQGAPLAGKGATASKLGTTKRPDGKRQVTYKRVPAVLLARRRKLQRRQEGR